MRKPALAPGKRFLSRVEYDKHNINPNDIKNWVESRGNILVSTKNIISDEISVDDVLFLLQAQNYRLVEDSYILRNPHFDTETGVLKYELDRGVELPEDYFVKVDFYKLDQLARRPIFSSEEVMKEYDNKPPVYSVIFPYVYLAKKESV